MSRVAAFDSKTYSSNSVPIGALPVTAKNGSGGNRNTGLEVGLSLRTVCSYSNHCKAEAKTLLLSSYVQLLSTGLHNYIGMLPQET